MKFRSAAIVAVVCLDLWATHGVASEPGDPAKGEQVFRVCAACHSVIPERHMTGPSLAGIWGHKAGSIESFRRYSSALQQAGVIWNEDTLDAWLVNPQGFIPGNRMTFRGLPDEAQRKDLIAFLRQVSERARAPQGQQAHGPSERSGGGGMMSPGEPLDLKSLQPNNRVTSVRYCGDTYTIATESGETHAFWEFNLRIKTDSSQNGPQAKHPVIVPGGMMGDRAFLVFASPAEIGPFINSAC